MKKEIKKVRAKKISMELDMAPMCDLGFLLITFFMFTTTFSKPSIVKLNMPPNTQVQDKDRPNIKSSNTLAVIIGKGGEIYWHQQASETVQASGVMETKLSKDGIREVILAAKSKATEPMKFTVKLKPTEDSEYKYLISMLDEIKITEIPNYGVYELSEQEKTIYSQLQ